MNMANDLSQLCLLKLFYENRLPDEPAGCRIINHSRVKRCLSAGKHVWEDPSAWLSRIYGHDPERRMTSGGMKAQIYGSHLYGELSFFSLRTSLINYGFIFSQLFEV